MAATAECDIGWLEEFFEICCTNDYVTDIDLIDFGLGPDEQEELVGPKPHTDVGVVIDREQVSGVVIDQEQVSGVVIDGEQEYIDPKAVGVVEHGHPALGHGAVSGRPHADVGVVIDGEQEYIDPKAVGAGPGGRRRRRRDFPKSRYEHVYWSDKQNKWNVRVKHPITKRQKCGSFVDEIDAARDADNKVFLLYSQDPSIRDRLVFNFFKPLE